MVLVPAPTGVITTETVTAKASGTANTSFRLPDGTTTVSVRCSHEPTVGTEPVLYGVYVQDEQIAAWLTEKNVTTRVSLLQVQDERAEVDVVRRLDLLSPSIYGKAEKPDSHDNAEVLERTWISVYALWLALADQDTIAISVAANSLITNYLIATGLAALSSFGLTTGKLDQNSRVLLLAREPFWQGAGAPDSLFWLRARPESSFPGFNSSLGAFASQQSFTRKGNVCTTHPLRPPKPAPGTVIYSRYIVELGQHLELVHIDAENPLHFQKYCTWQNSDRVNHGWRERGPDEKHRAYLGSQLNDPHTMSLIFLWDGEPAGYSEVGWAMEDNVARFVNSNCNIHIGEFDQLSHIFVGEEKFRGAIDIKQ